MLLLTLLAVQPVAAAPLAADEGGRGWLETLDAWWGQLIERLSVGSGLEQPAAVSPESGGEGGPGIDPGGASAGAEGEDDGGPDIDPGG